MEPKTRQYFGPSPRHPQACVELSFPVDDRKFRLSAIAEALADAKIHLLETLNGGPLDLPEAIGALACALLSRTVAPPWSWGRENGTGWTCLSYPRPPLAARALILAHGAILASSGRDAAIPAELLSFAARGPTIDYVNAAMMQAAAMLGLDSAAVSHRIQIYQIGQGARGMHFMELASQNDSAIFGVLARDKRLTVELLQRLGLPTTRAVSAANSAAVAAAARVVGFPCVVKPVDRGHGTGVTTGIRSESQLTEAIGHALNRSSFPLLVENHVDGDDHRMDVVNGQLLWVYRRTPPYVVGNGRSTIAELVALENERRAGASSAHRRYLKEVELDATHESYLRHRYELVVSSIPLEGQRIDLGGQANLAQGGTLKDVTSEAHPDNRELALRVARLFRANAIGIDFITPDIARSWRQVPSAIIEVNATPGISGLGDACHALRAMMPGRLSGRVPSFVAMGDETYRAAIEDQLRQTLRSRGLALARAGYRTRAHGSNISRSPLADEVETLLLNPYVEALLVSCTSDSVKSFGLPLQRCDLLFAPDADTAAGVDQLVARALVGKLSPEEVAQVVLETIEPYHADGQGGSRPTLEWRPDDSGAQAKSVVAHLRCWRVRSLPRGWFWRQISGRQEFVQGLIGQADLLAAVASLTDARLLEQGQQALAPHIAAPEPAEGWEAPYIDADIALPSGGQEIVRNALHYAVTAVNRLVDFPV